MTSIAQALRYSCRQMAGSRHPGTNSSTEWVPPARLRFVGMGFNLLARFNRELAAEWLSRYWFRVFKPGPRPWAQTFWKQADSHVELHLHDKTIPVHVWGQGPLVVCMHGWGGSGTQFKRLIPGLVAAGFQVAAFDAPAHGDNPGEHTHIVEFTQALIAVQAQIRPVYAVVAHSFGAMATLMAAYQELKIERMVLIAPGLDVTDIFANYCNRLGLDARLANEFHIKVGQRMGELALVDDPWHFFRPQKMMNYAPPRGLLIYDSEDEEMPTRHFEEILDHWPQADEFVTTGLGHYRILKDAAVKQKVVEWLHRGKSRISSGVAELANNVF